MNREVSGPSLAEKQLGIEDSKLTNGAALASVALSRFLLSGEGSLKQCAEEFAKLSPKERQGVLKEAFSLSLSRFDQLRNEIADFERSQESIISSQARGTLFEEAAFPAWRDQKRAELRADFGACWKRVQTLLNSGSHQMGFPGVEQRFIEAVNDYVRSSRKPAPVAGFVQVSLQEVIAVSERTASEAINSCLAGFPLPSAVGEAKAAKRCLELALKKLPFQSQQAVELQGKITELLDPRSDLSKVAAGQYTRTSF